MSHRLLRKAQVAECSFRLRQQLSLLIFTSLIVSLFTITLPSTPTSASELTTQRPKATFYLDVELGCYSRSFISVTQIPFGDVKKVYRVSCLSPHHFEVFSVDSSPKVRSENDEQAHTRFLKECKKKQSKLTFNPRSPASYNWSNMESVNWGNWSADGGPEEKRYGRKFVCYVSLGVMNQKFHKEVNMPLIRGFEQYAN